MASEACRAELDRCFFSINIQQTHIPQLIDDIHRTYTIISTRHCFRHREKNIEGYKTATIQKQSREKRHVNVLWSAVKDFENNFAPKKYLIYNRYIIMLKKT